MCFLQQLSEDLASKMADEVVNGNTPVSKQPEIAESKCYFDRLGNVLLVD